MSLQKESRMNIAIITDSNSGITQAQAAELGVYVVPMPFMIDGETYEEGITLSAEEFYDKQAAGADISTSQPSPATVTGLWDRLLMTYDQIVHIPMSSGLSGSCQTATVLADDYDGKVEVVNNQRISVTQRQSVLDAKELAESGLSAYEIRTILEKTKFDSSIYIMVETLKYLKKGGRITASAAALGTLLKIKPVLQIRGEKLDSFAKARTAKQAKGIILSAIARDLDTLLHDPQAERCCLQVAHCQNPEGAKELEDELKALYPGVPVYTDALSLSIACHIGPGAFAAAVTGRIDLPEQD